MHNSDPSQYVLRWAIYSAKTDSYLLRFYIQQEDLPVSYSFRRGFYAGERKRERESERVRERERERERRDERESSLLVSTIEKPTIPMNTYKQRSDMDREIRNITIFLYDVVG
ncbi:unnamed protein product [Nezara viridula]|uniref:Uncharacterized protein n=1 Tax=Nezara viridula TaxID=85310 RepID=A0A9P0MXP8_NEZVI|nr:unnamed protein product [Nezara viridula]